MFKSKWLLATMTLSLPALAWAGDGHNRVERAQDRQEVRQNKQEQRDDHRDLRQLESLLSRYDVARARGSRNELLQVEAQLRDYVNAELHESRRELAKDEQEIRRSTREVRADGNGWHSSGVTRADDRQDRRDDVRDARVESASLRQTRAIAQELNGLYARMDRRSLQRKATLMGDLLRLARAEQGQNRAEQREDRNEIREDGPRRR